jgi:hypothetical protein
MIDYIILTILGISLIYTWQLNGKIQSLKNAKEDLSILMQGFDEAIMRAEMSIKELRQFSANTLNDIQTKVNEAKQISNELSFLTDRAIELNEKLEKSTITSKSHLNRMILGKQRKFIDNDLDGGSVADTVPIERQEKIVKRSNSIDELVGRISQMREQRENNMVSQEQEQPYKPTIISQDGYYNLLKRVKK